MTPAHRAALAALAILLATPAAAQRRGGDDDRTPRGAPCTVADVHDGDTLRCTDGRRVRLLGIDTPELAQRPWGQRARAALERLAPRRSTVTLEFDRRPRDRYGRLLAYLIAADGTVINERMIAEGFALVYDDRDNRARAAGFRRAERAARAANAGLWGAGGFACAPIDFRRDRCR